MKLGIGIGLTAQQSSAPDTTAPEFVTSSYDDGTDTFTGSASEAATLHWARYLNANGVPTLNSGGTWTGTTAETGSVAVSGSIDETFATSATNYDRIAVGLIDGAGNVIASLFTAVDTPPAAFSAAYTGTAAAAAAVSDPTTISAVPIGAADTDRWVVVAISTLSSSSTDAAITSVTIDGGSVVDLAGSEGTGTARTRFFNFYRSAAKIPTGTTVDVVVDWAVTPDTDKDVRVWAYTISAANAPTLAASDDSHNTAGLSVGVQAGDKLIAGLMSLNGSDPATGWTGATHRASADHGNASLDEWGGVADDFSITATETRAVSHTLTTGRHLSAIVLRETP